MRVREETGNRMFLTGLALASKVYFVVGIYVSFDLTPLKSF